KRDELGTDFHGVGLIHSHANRKVDSNASVASTKAALNRSGTRNRRSLALHVSTSTTSAASTSNFTPKATTLRPSAAGDAAVAMPSGRNTFASSVISTSCLRDAPHSINARYRPEYSRSIAS